MRLSTVLILALAAITVALASFAADLCDPGFYSPDGNTPCEPCPVGYAAPFAGSTECTPCAAGTFTDVNGSAVCSICPEGTIAPFEGAAQCESCPPGETSNPSRTECVPLTVPVKPSSWGLLKSRYGKA